MSSRLAAVAAIEIDARQGFLLESDKLKEMLGASRLMDESREFAKRLFRPPLRVFQAVSGDVRVWTDLEHRTELLETTWKFRRYLQDLGVSHSCAYIEVNKRHFMEVADKPLNGQAVSDSDEEPARPSLAWVQRRLSRVIGSLKARRANHDAQPSASLFAPCRIHPLDYANAWRQGDGNEPRRDLVGWRAASKRRRWEEDRGDLERLLEERIMKRVGSPAEADGLRMRPSFELGQLVEQRQHGQSDSFIAYLCADGDGVGSLLQFMDWNDRNDTDTPWKRNRDFVTQFNEAVNEAYHDACASVCAADIKAVGAGQPADGDRPTEHDQGASGTYYIPMLPQLLGGDDLWTVCRRHVALPLAVKFEEAFAKRAGNDKAIQAALEIARPEAARLNVPLNLTMSIGVCFAKAGHPAYAQAEAAEWLLNRSAKRLRKGHFWPRGEAGQGCIDWHWIESSLAEDVAMARQQGWQYGSQSRSEHMLLTSRPWDRSQTRELLEASAQFAAGVPRRKREQLEQILRRGYSLSLLAWADWLNSLRPSEQDVVCEIAARLDAVGIITDKCDWLSADSPARTVAAPDRSPWRSLNEHCAGSGHRPDAETARFDTPWLDLLSLEDVQRGHGNLLGWADEH